jgi:type IV pilus assembly protein PilE
MNTKINARRRFAKGFTLLELMTVVAIVAILATIVYPNYTRSVRKSRRTEAKTVLLDLAGREERRFSTMSSYSTKPSDLQYDVSPQTDASPFNLKSGFYKIEITNSSTTAFTIKATGINAQAADTDCTSFTVDNTGKQDSTGSSATCW